MIMEEQKAGANNWIGVIIIVVILVGAFFFVSQKPQVNLPDRPVVSAIPLDTIPLFTDGLAAAGVTADRIGFHSFSPDGKYFFFSAFTEGSTPGNAAYLMTVSDGVVTKLPGFPERGFDDSRVLQLAGTNGITLYDPATKTSKSYDVGANAGFGALSPDGKTYAVNTQTGIKLINRDSGEITSLSTAQYDGAYAWYPDSTRILGYQESGENLFEAGKGRTLGVWNSETKSFTALTSSITDKNIRLIQWVVPGVVARVNTGWDDGSHDYLINVDTKKVIDVGDTSGALMGGVAIDSSRGLFAVVGGDDGSMIGSTVMVYRGMEREYELTLPKGYFRQNARIVSKDRLIYLRTKWNDTRAISQELVSLDMKTGTETVLRELLAQEYVSLSLSPDRTMWIISSGSSFITGAL